MYCTYIFVGARVRKEFIYIYIHVGPGFRGPAVTGVAKREIELHFRDVCVIPSRTHTRSGWPVEMKFPVLSPRRRRSVQYIRVQ